jgi:CRP-like cAMP-binding protein
MSDTSAAVEILDSVYSLSADLKKLLTANFEVLKTPKRAFLLKEGEKSEYFIVLLEGAARAYVCKENNSQVTKRIIHKSKSLRAIVNFCDNKPSKEYVETLTECEFAGISLAKMIILATAYSELNKLIINVKSDYLTLVEENLELLRNCKPEQRFKHFIKKYPGLINNIKDDYIASFLNISTRTLSRLKKDSKS